MEAEVHNYNGEIEWFKIGKHLTIDEDHRSLDDLIDISIHEVEELSSLVQNRPIDEKEQAPLLKKLLESLRHKYEQLYISDNNGDYFNADQQKNNIQDRLYFNKAMKGLTVVSEPIINKSTNKPIIAVVTPIRRDGKIVGLFGVTILIDTHYKGFRFIPLTYGGKTTKKKNWTHHAKSARKPIRNALFAT
jgi:hypothetical protein